MTETQHRILIERFKADDERAAAAAACGVSDRTVYRWINRGLPEESGPFRELADAAKLERLALSRRRQRAGQQRTGRRK